MKTDRASIKQQLQHNVVALISLVVAVTSLGYNTWRNEANEYNRNQRLVSIIAAIEALRTDVRVLLKNLD